MLPFPHQCVICRTTLPARRPISLCGECEESLPWLPPGCVRCGLAFIDAGISAGERDLCPQCRRESPPFDRCLGLFEYRRPASLLISRFKDRADFAAGRILGHLLADQFVRHHQEERRPLPEALLPVPLHPRRLCARGYNQALELGRSVARYAGLPLLGRHCRRCADTASQRGLDRAARGHNMEEAFGMRKGGSLTLPHHIAIIDDVVTTGATVSSLARLLRRQGVTTIDVWCLARVEPPD